MNVKQLREELEKYDDDVDVLMAQDNGWNFARLDFVENDMEYYEDDLRTIIIVTDEVDRVDIPDIPLRQAVILWT